MAPALQVVDHGWEKFSMAVRALADEHGVQVGVIGERGDEEREGGMTNAQIAAIHEFGSEDGRIPERSFMRASFNAHKAEYINMLGQLLVRCLDGKLSADKAFGLVGLKISTDMKLFVTAGDEVPPPNAPSTIERKLGREHAKVGKARMALDKALAAGKKAGLKALNRYDDAREALSTARGQVRTLVDTGKMVAAITWKVIGRGDVDEEAEGDE